MAFTFVELIPLMQKKKDLIILTITLNALTKNHYKLVVLVIDAYQTDCALRHLQKFLVTNMVKFNFKLWIWSMLVNHEIF